MSDERERGRAAPPGPGKARWPSWLWLASLMAASIGLWLALSVVPFLPTNDGPQHVMMGHIENHYDDPDTVYRHFLGPAPQYAARGFAALFVPLESVLPWRSALRLTLYVILLAWSWGFTALVMALDPRRRWLALLGFATAFQWSLYMGFFAFAAGSACSLLLVALALTSRDWSRKRFGILAAGLLLQGSLHVFSALLAAMVIALAVVAQHAGGRARLRAAAGMAAACTPLLLLVACTLVDRGKTVETHYAEATVFVPLGEKLRYLHRCFAPGADYRGLALFALCAAALGLLVRRRVESRQRALGLASLLLLLAALSGPATLPAWQLFFQRFLPLGVMLALALLPVERMPTWGRAAAALAIAGFTVASLAEAAAMNRKLYDRSADVYSGLDAPLRRTGLRLPILRDPWFALPPSKSPVPGMVPLHAVGGLFVTEQGGMIPYMFLDSPSVHQFMARDAAWESDMPARPPADLLQQIAHDPPGSARRLGVLDELAFAGTGYEDVLLVSAPADADRFLGRGYQTDYRKGELFIGHYRGCEVDVSLPPIAGLSEVEYGWWPRADASKRAKTEGLAPGADGRVHVALPAAPCGPVWVRLPPSLSAGACRGADASGRLLVEAAVGRRTTVPCDP